MFIRIFVEAEEKEEALRYAKEFENMIINCVVGLEITKTEKYWKFPELYCVEWSFKNVIDEQMSEVMKRLGSNPKIIKSGENIEEYIFAITTGKIYLERIEWILINVSA